MDDMISRQDAIDVVSKWFEKIELNGDICVDGLRQLPSATDTNVGAKLGTNLAEVGTDCISRQHVTGALRDYLVGKRCPDDGTLTCRLIENEVINKLPQIQPEIVRCKDCKHHWTHKCMDSMPIERCDLGQTFYDADVDFCSLAEKKEVTE